MNLFELSVVVGLLMANLVATLAVKHMLQEHHDKTAADRAHERDEAFDGDQGGVALRE